MAGYLRTKTYVTPNSQAKTGAEKANETFVFVGYDGAKTPSSDARLTVSEVAKLTGVPATKLRHYDDKRLLCPARSGEGVSNNRKLYDVNDLERLQAILTLSAYGFSLDEIRHVLDDEDTDLYEVMSDKLFALKLQENRLRNLIRFAQFIELTDTELLEGLACGPADLERLADFARRSSRYRQTIEKLLEMSDEKAEAAFESLDPIVADYLLVDETEGFAGVESVIDAFFTWWTKTIAPSKAFGYLEFWAVFEDHSLVAERAEELGGEGIAGFLEMSAFFVMMKRLLAENAPLIHKIAELAAVDVVAALECAQELVATIAQAMLGDAVSYCSSEELSAVALHVLAYTEGILADEGLLAYLELDDNLDLASCDVAQAAKVVEVMCGEE